MKDGAAVGAVAVTGISKGSETCLIGCKCLPGHLCGLPEYNDHEGAHQVGCIRLLIEGVGAVVEQFHVFVAFV